MSDIWNGTKTAYGDGGSGGSVYAAGEMPVNWIGDTVGVLLGSDNTAYSFNADDGDYVGDIFDGGVTAEEFAGTGYTRADGEPANPTITEDNANDRAEYDADDVTFSGLNGDTIQFAILAKQGGADWTTFGDDPLLAYLTSANFPLATNGGDVTLTFDSEGIWQIT